MKILGIAKLTSKKGNKMAKVQCERAFTAEDSARLELCAGVTVEDVWLYAPLMDKLDASCIGKDLEPIYSFVGGRPQITDIKIK